MMRILTLFFALLLTGKASATGEINVLTDLLSPFPAGCVSGSLPNAPADDDNQLWDEIVRAPGIGSNSLDADVLVTIWRVGCQDPEFSVVMVRLQQLSGPRPVLVPQVFVEAGEVDVPDHEAQLISHPAVGFMSASGSVMSETGQTFMLAADPLPLSDGPGEFFFEEYNDVFTLELFWEAYSPNLGPRELFPIDGYFPEFDPPQFDVLPLHGRMSGTYTVPGKAATGLFLNIGELADDRNWLFATFFTYIDGNPIWIAGNTEGQLPGFDRAEIEMQYIEGGVMFTDPTDFSEADVDRQFFGTLVLEAVDCNAIRLEYDFRNNDLGRDFGQGSMIVERLTRIAGYDCNPWLQLGEF